MADSREHRDRKLAKKVQSRLIKVRNLPVKFGGDTLRRFGCRLSGGKKKKEKKKEKKKKRQKQKV